MLIFISFARHCAREQQLLSHPAIGGYLYRHSCQCIEANDSLEFAAVLTSHALPFHVPGESPPLLSPDHREDAELERIRSWASERGRELAGAWVMILRPCMGRISEGRINHFHSALTRMDHLDQGTTILAESLMPHDFLTNPVWNLRAAPRRFRMDSELRLPHVRGLSKDALKEVCPELHEAFTSRDVLRSQDAPELYFSDNALYAVKMTGGSVPIPEGGARVTVECSPEVMADMPLFYRLPLFSMDPDEPVDCSPLDALCAARLRRMKGQE